MGVTQAVISKRLKAAGYIQKQGNWVPHELKPKDVEMLKPGETINGERYRTQLIRLKRAIAEKRPKYATRHEAIIFHHDNARPHVAISVKN